MSESVLSDIETLVDRLSIDRLSIKLGRECFVIHSPRFNKHAREEVVNLISNTACVQKRMVESHLIYRLLEVIYQTNEGAFRLI